MAASAKQKAARARFAAMARSQRGAVAFPTARSFRSARKTMHGAWDQFKHGSWGERLLGFGVGYFLPQTLAKTGIGTFAYNSVPQYAGVVDQMYNAVGGDGNPNNPWAYGGVVGMGKVIGGALLAKDAYDYRETGKLSRAKANFGIPFELGMLLDGPELNPLVQYGEQARAPATFGAGGVSW